MSGLLNPSTFQLVAGIVNARQFGAVGNGVADDTAALQAALDFQKAAGGGIVYLPAGTYLIKRSLFLGSKVTLMGAGRGATTITKPASIKSLLTANAAANAHSATITDATGFAVGMGIHLWDTTNFDGWTSTNAVITGIAGNVVTFSRPDDAGGLWGAINTARAGTMTSGFPLIRNDAACVNMGVRDLTLDHNQNANDPALASVDFTSATIHLEESYYGLFENLELLNAAGDAYSDQAQRDATGVLTISSVKTTKNTFRGCRIRNATRHGVHLGTIMNGAYILNNEITSCAGYGMFYCAYVTHTVANGNLVDGCGSGFAGIDDRDSDNVIANNVIKAFTAYGIEATTFGGLGATPGRLVITGNEIDRPSASGTSAAIALAQPDCVVANNRIYQAAAGGAIVRIYPTADRTLFQGNVLEGAQAGGSIALELQAGADECRIIGNSFRNIANSVLVNGVLRLVAIGNLHTGTTARSWWFDNATSTDCVIRNEANAASALAESVAATRLVYEGIGTNGAADPASSGAWNGISGRRYDGQMVRWNSGGGEKISIFYNGVGWTALN